MKAYLVKDHTKLAPFSKTAGEMRFGSSTVRSRLESQLNGFQIISVDHFDFDNFEPSSIALQDSLLISDNLLSELLNSLPDKNNRYQCRIEASRFPVFITPPLENKWLTLPLYYCGAADSEQRTISLSPASKREITQGMPKRMHTLSGMRISLPGFYGLPIRYWFDWLTASSLWCRDHMLRLITRADRIRLPNVSWLRPMLMRRSNQIGKRCRIHPNAVIEGCVIGDNVDIGPFTCLRASVIADNAVVREHSTINFSYVGEGAFIMGANLSNSYVGSHASIVTPMLYNSVVGECSFISGGSGFADFTTNAGNVIAHIEGQDIPSDLNFLGSCVGDDCFIGANLIFAPGGTIPNNTHLLDSSLIKTIPTSGGTYVYQGNEFIQIPNSFIRGQ